MSIPRPHYQATALVTGASSEIGTALAQQLGARGHHLTLVAQHDNQREDVLEDLAESIRDQHRVKVDVLTCDLAEPDARVALLDQIAARERRVDVLINNAGASTSGDFVGIETALELRQVRVLVEAVVDLASQVLPGMVERGEGAVLNVASTAAMQPMPWSAGYAAAKAHTLSFSEALHHEMADRGVSVTALCPGPSGMGISADMVAEIALAGLDKNRRVVVPGAMVRLTALGSKVTPRSVQLPALRRAMRPQEVDAG
ncbi:SDR family oxidoreductase [Nocardioides humilatus]|uniref:SDR family oxidoreductase n=1 Tax=Nocardioides humilatus TaxID=2607660 RepID=A0A5B1L462_9ACTN|nr:SDR family oxidoreductase [Nocardioides humilatus]KAA1415443.1 SDR family oxidoreductase [Nocardioides humilatus]